MKVPLPPKVSALGPIVQLGFVPRNFDAAVRFWTQKLGVGPFFMCNPFVVGRLVYRDIPIQLDFCTAGAHWGDIQIELIRQNDQKPSIYRDWNSNALHHVQIATSNYAAALEVCRAEGFPVVMEGQDALGIKGLKFAYCELGPEAPLEFVEFVDVPADAEHLREADRRMRAQARNWDGRDPLRNICL
jgi:hypothetical protein